MKPSSFARALGLLRIWTFLLHNYLALRPGTERPKARRQANKTSDATTSSRLPTIGKLSGIISTTPAPKLIK